VIRVLPQYYRFDIFIGAKLNGVKDIIHVGVYVKAAVLLNQKPAQIKVIFLLEFLRKQLLPVVA
jgi:hypothetical protein